MSSAAEARPLRVLLACDHIDHGGALHGAGRQIVALSRALDPARVRASIVVRGEESDLGRQLRSEGLPIRFLGHGRFDPRTLWSLTTAIRAGPADLVHATDFGAATFGRVAGRLTSVPVIVHVRSHHSEHQPRGFPFYVSWAYRALSPLTARAIAISRSVAEFAVQRMGFDPEEVEILNNPLAGFSTSCPPPERLEELRRSYGTAPGDPVVGCVTRFHAAKGVEYLVEAFAPILDRFPDARLMLVGEGPGQPALERRATELGVADRVIFTGFRRDVEEHYALFTVSAVPSVEEGFGNVAVESMAMGVPVVASELGGLPEIVGHGENGLLVPPADPAALAEALLSILEDPARRARMAEAARQRSRDFSMASYVERLEALYRSVLSDRARAT